MNLAGWPQYTVLIWWAVVLVIYAVLDGEPRSGKHRFSSAAVQIIGSAFVLWQGGFFA